MQASAWIAIAIGCIETTSCSPYAYTDQVAAVSQKFSAASGAFKQGSQDELQEQHNFQRLVWAQTRPELYLGSGCTPDGSGPVPCIITEKKPTADAAGALQSQSPPAQSRKPQEDKKVVDACDEIGARPLQEPATAKQAADNLTRFQRDDLLKDISRYLDGLVALTNATDRAAFDAAAAKVAAAVGVLASTAGAAAGGAGTAAGPMATASTNALLWLVGTALDERRYSTLREATRLACRPVRVLSRALEFVLEEQRGNRLGVLSSTISRRVFALNSGRSIRVLSNQAYGSAVDDLFATVDSYELVRKIDPAGLASAIADSHDKLALAVYRGDRQSAEFTAALESLSKNVSALVAATHTNSTPSVAK